MKTIVLLGLVFGLVACGGGSGDSGSGDPGSAGAGDPGNGSGGPNAGGDGTVTFDTFTKISGMSPQLEDINGDKAVDMISSDCNAPWATRVSDGHGGYSEPIVDSLARTKCPTLVDLNGDKLADTFVRTDSTHLGIALSKGDGTFGATIAIVIDANAQALQLSDIDGDGKKDIVWGTTNGWLCVTVAADGTPIGPTKCGGVLSYDTPVCDFDEDGKLDILKGKAHSLYAGTRALLDVNKPNVPDDIEAAACGDVDGDGHVDVVATRLDTSTSVDAAAEFRHGPEVDVFHGNGDGTFEPAARFPLDASPGNVLVAADVAHIGRSQIAWKTGATGEMRLLTAAKDLATLKSQPLPSRWGVTATAAFYDLNGDKKLDMVVRSDNDFFVGLQK